MNKNFTKAAVIIGLATMSLSFTACNTNTNDTPDAQGTGIINQQNTTGSSRYSNNGYQRMGNTQTDRNGIVDDTPNSPNGTQSNQNGLTGNNQNNQNGLTGNNQNNQNGLTGNTKINQNGLSQNNQMGLNSQSTQNNQNTNAGNSSDILSRCQNIEKQLLSVSNVKDVKVVVVGNTAIVACDANNSSTDANSLKNAITQKLKSIDPSITDVVITQSSDMKTNMQQMFDNMGNKSMDQITQDFDKLLSKIRPAAS